MDRKLFLPFSSPGGLATALCGFFDEVEIHLAEIVDVNVSPLVLSFADHETEFVLHHAFGHLFILEVLLCRGNM